jgi:hypothetical protein
LPNAKKPRLIAAKPSKTPSKTRSLKNADLELDFFFMDEVWDEWWISLTTPGAFQHRFSWFFYFPSWLWSWNAVFSETRASASRFFYLLKFFRERHRAT